MRFTAVLLCAALLAPACARDSGSSGKLDVVTAVYPLTYVAERVGGARVRVIDVAPSGAEPHDIELTPTQVGRVEQADLVVLVRGLQPALDDAAPDDRTFDALAGARGDDPHVWLDPVLLSAIAGELAKRLGAIDTEHAAEYRRNADSLVRGLVGLHADAAKALKTCAREDLVTSHAAFGRFATRYGLRATGIAGPDDEAEPSPRRIADVVALVRKNRVTTVFAESADSKPAQTVAREAGVKVEVLDPVEVFRGDDYVTVMKRNVAAVRAALGCA